MLDRIALHRTTEAQKKLLYYPPNTYKYQKFYFSQVINLINKQKVGDGIKVSMQAVSGGLLSYILFNTEKGGLISEKCMYGPR